MASNVFGTPVTVEMLKEMPEYADEHVITRNDLANVALNLKNADGKDVRARKYVEDMYKGFEGLECVLGLIYNATGALLRYVYAVDFYGFVAPAPYPMFIENGQWGAFLYVKYKSQEYGAAGCVVYRGYDLNGVQIDYFVGWDNKVGAQLSRYAEMGAEGAYNYNGKGFSQLYPKVQDSGAQYTYLVKDGFFSTAIIGNDKMAARQPNYQVLQMACNVFGTPVREETMRGMAEYANKDTIMRQDLAEATVAMKN
ncbi:hypothetical protein Cgig2_004050 [Carnegiea gigantea]|uniref:Uncharacterized protein n=1 Tax=Carnegiea gigantea TaxID=171969 RepID=A0A9Q1QQV2_9CARY|nr:hypothetical protein Cgig2_004050 [Carnegiea gigantea]